MGEETGPYGSVDLAHDLRFIPVSSLTVNHFVLKNEHFWWVCSCLEVGELLGAGPKLGLEIPHLKSEEAARTSMGLLEERTEAGSYMVCFSPSPRIKTSFLILRRGSQW